MGREDSYLVKIKALDILNENMEHQLRRKVMCFSDPGGNVADSPP